MKHFPILFSLFCISLIGCTSQSAVPSNPQYDAFFIQPTIQIDSETMTEKNRLLELERAPSTTSPDRSILKRLENKNGTNLEQMPSRINQFSLDMLEDWLVQMYKSKSEPSEVRQELLAAGFLSDMNYATMAWDPYNQVLVDNSSFFTTIDIDGDFEDEWFVTINTKDHLNICGSTFAGELWVIDHSGISFKLGPSSPEPNWTMPAITIAEDFTGDNLLDVVTVSIGCTAHTVFGMFHLISAHHNQVENIITMNEKYEESGHLQRSLSIQYDPNTDWTHTGIAISQANLNIENVNSSPSLIISGGTYASAGAGCTRSRSGAVKSCVSET